MNRNEFDIEEIVSGARRRNNNYVGGRSLKWCAIFAGVLFVGASLFVSGCPLSMSKGERQSQQDNYQIQSDGKREDLGKSNYWGSLRDLPGFQRIEYA